MAQEKLVDYAGLAEEVGIPVRTLRTLAHRRVIPRLILGHRTVLFAPSKVIAALQRYEITEVGRLTRVKKS
jgi:hypothetical protein